MVEDYPAGDTVKVFTSAAEDNNPALVLSRTTAIEPQPHHQRRMGTDRRGNTTQWQRRRVATTTTTRQQEWQRRSTTIKIEEWYLYQWRQQPRTRQRKLSFPSGVLYYHPTTIVAITITIIISNAISNRQSMNIVIIVISIVQWRKNYRRH